MKRTIWVTLAAVTVAGTYLIASSWMRPSVRRERIRIARVEHGPIEATLTSSGTVVPEFEQVLSSPIDSRVVRILKRPGNPLRKGEAIMELDVSQSQLNLEKLNEQLALKINQQSQRKLELENRLIDLQGQTTNKRLDLKSYQLQLAQQRKLWEVGLTPEGELRRAEVQEEKAQTELKQLQEASALAARSTQTQLDGLNLEIQTLQKEIIEARRQLELATTRADRDGVLTWVVTEEGSAVRKGDTIARVADLESFRVEAKISDVYSNRLSPGLPVKVKVDENYLRGTVYNILPTIKDGVITFLVSLNDKSSQLLRANLRVDVYIVTDHKDRTVRLRRGPFSVGEGNHNVFVIRGGVAVKTPVQLGISDFDYIEVVRGLIEGDEVIISDMSEYSRVKELKII
jgi:HlyD family secretion protein